MLTGEYHWTLGTIIGLPVAGFLIAAMIAIAILGLFADEGDRGIIVGSGVLAAVFGLVVTGITFWPWAGGNEYHAWNEVRGSVVETNTRIISNGDQGVSQRYVIRFAESKNLYGCDDTRCALAKPGDVLTLACKREWQYQADSGWGCRYGKGE